MSNHYKQMQASGLLVETAEPGIDSVGVLDAQPVPAQIVRREQSPDVCFGRKSRAFASGGCSLLQIAVLQGGADLPAGCC